MTLPVWLITLTDSWSSYYGNHQLLSVSVQFLHLAGLMVAGGMALTTDWRVWRATWGTAVQRRQALSAIQASHRTVAPALMVVIATGVLLTAADLSTFLESQLFWMKIGLVALLMVNGLSLRGAEAAAARSAVGGGWSWLLIASGASLVLWLLALFVGTWLPVAA
ncbi:MAG: hypothetical protein AB7I50_05795 [Vicinamibacterales bacterium]